MSSLSYTYKYNGRHKFVIAVFVTLALAAQILPYRTILSEPVEKDHKQCFELSKQPKCESEQATLAYEIYSTDPLKAQPTKFATCEEYYSTKKMGHTQSLFEGILSLIVMFADVIAAIVFLCKGVKWLFVKVNTWLNTEDSNEVEDE
jgi:hypothetical protein